MLVVVGALAAAMVLGVVVAVVVNAVVLAPSRRPSESNPPTAAGQTTQPGATPIDQAALLSKVGGSVVTVVASTCSAADWSGNATGFLVNPTTVVTAWTGVAEAVSVAVLDPAGHPIPARISLADKALGVAVVEASRPIDGRTALQPAGGTLATGQRWYGLHLDTLRSKAPVLVPVGIGERGQGSLGGAVLQQALVTDVAAGDFAAGGPLVNGDGQVVGLMARYPDSDVLLAVGVDRLQQVLSSGSAPGTATCDLPLGPQGPFAPLSGSHDVLRQYFAAINAGDYATAWTLLPEKTRGKLETAAKGWNSTYDFNVAITDLGGGKVRAEFDSIFAAGKGPEPTLTCARWGIVYTIVDGLIANAKADRGAKGYEAC